MCTSTRKPRRTSTPAWRPLIGSLLVKRLVRFQMFAKTSFGVAPLAAIVLLVALATPLAAWLPAARAGNLDPVTALRHDA